MKFSAKLILLFSGLFLVTCGIAGYIGYTSTTSILEKKAKESLTVQAFHTMDKIDRMFFERRGDMMVLASDQVIASRTSSPEQIKDRLTMYRDIYKSYISLSFFDLKRIRIADTSEINIGTLHPFNEYWPDIAKGNDFVMLTSESKSLNKAVFYLAARVKDKQGIPFGVVVSKMPIESIYEIAQLTSGIYRSQNDLKVELLDKDGLILYSSYNAKGILKEQSEDWKVLSGLIGSGMKSGSIRHDYAAADEITAFVREEGYRDFMGNNWILTICTPAKVALLDTIEQRNRFIIIFSVLGILALLGTIIFSRTVTRPLKELSAAAVEIGKGNLAVTVDNTAGDEIGQLSRAFNHMALNLKESEKKYKDLAELLPQVVFETDDKGNLIFANRHALTLFGYQQDDLEKGLNVLQVFAIEDRERVKKNFMKGMRCDKLENIDLTALRKDGTTFPLLSFSVPIIHEDKPIGIRGIAIDITERKHAEDKLREAEQEWARTFDAITDPIMIIDTHHRILKANKSMADKLGIEQATAAGLICFEAVHGSHEPPSFCPHASLLKDGLPHSREIHIEKLGGDYIISVSPLFTPEGVLYGSVHYAKDITERRSAEEKISLLNRELEQKVADRTQQLLDAQEELVRKKNLSILGQLSASVGHELRNPMGVISNAVYFLQNVIPKADETVREYLGIIKSEVNNSQRIITDLLDFTRTKMPQTMVITVDEVIKQSLGKCTVPQGIALRVETPDTLPVVKVDSLQMEQVFQNLVTNAVQAMPDGGELRIAARWLGAGLAPAQSGYPQGIPLQDFVEISVTDTGEGISPENMKKLFQPLFTTKARGIGLGLTVVKNLIEANGGRIEVKSELGKGTTFTVILPGDGKGG